MAVRVVRRFLDGEELGESSLRSGGGLPRRIPVPSTRWRPADKALKRALPGVLEERGTYGGVRSWGADDG